MDSPGPIDTPALSLRTAEQDTKNLLNTVPFGRAGNPDEVVASLK